MDSFRRLPETRVDRRRTWVEKQRCAPETNGRRQQSSVGRFLFLTKTNGDSVDLLALLLLTRSLQLAILHAGALSNAPSCGVSFPS